MKRVSRILLGILIVWLLFAQGCMRFRISDSAAKEDFQKANVPAILEKINIEGKNIHYAIAGDEDKPTVVFFHGSPGAWNAFEDYMRDKELLQKFRMVSVDRPGFGYSDYGDAMSISQQAELFGELLKKLQNGKPVYIAGHSLGGPLCVLLAAKYPNYINGVVLLAASVDPAEEKPEKWRAVMKQFPLKYLLPGAFRPSNIELFYFKKDVLLMQDALQKIKVPVVIVHGEKDNLVPIENAYFAQKNLSNSDSVVMMIMPDANHFIPWNRYTIIKKALFQLLSL